jgi:hypothetical protein
MYTPVAGIVPAPKQVAVFPVCRHTTQCQTAVRFLDQTPPQRHYTDSQGPSNHVRYHQQPQLTPCWGSSHSTHNHIRSTDDSRETPCAVTCCCCRIHTSSCSSSTAGSNTGTSVFEASEPWPVSEEGRGRLGGTAAETQQVQHASGPNVRRKTHIVQTSRLHM